MIKTLTEGTASCGKFEPRALLTRLILGVLAAATLPADSKLLLREAATSARHARRHGQYVGPVCRTIHQGRSRLCPCGSGKKYKRCHLSIDTAEAFRRQHGFAAKPVRTTGKTLAKAA